MKYDLYKKSEPKDNLINGWFCAPAPDGDGDEGDGDDTGSDQGDDHTGEGGGDDTGDDPESGHDGDGEPGGDEGDGDGSDDPAPVTMEAISELIDQKLNSQSTTTEGDGGGGGGDDGSGTIKAPSTSNANLHPAIARMNAVKDQIVQYDDPNHQYHGLTVEQLAEKDPDELRRFPNGEMLYRDIVDGKYAHAQHQKSVEDQHVAQVRQEEDEFRASYAKAVFDGAPSSLTPEQSKEMENALGQVEGWMTKEGKYGITIEEAYYLMDRKGHLSKAASDAARKVIDAATRGGVHHVSSKKEDSSTTKGADMSKWSADRLLKHIDGLSEEKYVEFLSKASKAVRKAHPNLPWD